MSNWTSTYWSPEKNGTQHLYHEREYFLPFPLGWVWGRRAASLLVSVYSGDGMAMGRTGEPVAPRSLRGRQMKVNV